MALAQAAITVAAAVVQAPARRAARPPGWNRSPRSENSCPLGRMRTWAAITRKKASLAMISVSSAGASPDCSASLNHVCSLLNAASCVCSASAPKCFNLQFQLLNQFCITPRLLPLSVSKFLTQYQDARCQGIAVGRCLHRGVFILLTACSMMCSTRFSMVVSSISVCG